MDIHEQSGKVLSHLAVRGKDTSVTRKKAKCISRRYSLTKLLVFSKTDAVCTYTGRVGSAF